MTDPGKFAPGLKGFPTPNTVPTETGCRVFVFPASDDWSGLLMGALQPLLNPYNYYLWGALTPEETADAWNDILNAAVANPTCAADVPAPYWDETTADDADDEMPVGTQIWYGQIVETMGFVAEDTPTLTFLDNVGIWAIAGFIAYAGLPGAAIAFVPLAQKFTLAFKQHNIGAVAHILVDFLHLADVDTYGVEDGIVTYDVIMPDDGDPHTLYVEMSDTSNPEAGDHPQLAVIRKRLTADEITPPNTRYDATCDCIQMTTDGGTTWVDNPGLDPRHYDGYRLPARTGTDPQCNSAANMRAKLESMVNIFEQDIAIFQALSGLLAIILVFLGGAGILIDLLLAIVEELVTIGASAISTAFTTEQWDIILCILYCNIGSDGQVSEAQFNQIITDIHTRCSTVVYDVMFTLLPGIGWVGLSNAGAIGTETADCSGCDCTFCYVFDFSVDSYTSEGFSPVAPYGTYATGQGWQQAAGGLILDLLIPGGSVEVVSFDVEGTSFGGTGPYGRAVFWRLSGSTLITDNQSGISNPWTQNSTESTVIDEAWFNPYNGGSDLYITKITVHTLTAVAGWAGHEC